MYLRSKQGGNWFAKFDMEFGKLKCILNKILENLTLAFSRLISCSIDGSYIKIVMELILF